MKFEVELPEGVVALLVKRSGAVDAAAFAPLIGRVLLTRYGVSGAGVARFVDERRQTVEYDGKKVSARRVEKKGSAFEVEA